MPTTEKQRYTNKLNELAKRYGKLEDQTAREIQAMLQETRRQIIASLSDASTTQAGQFALEQLKGNIERQIAEFEARANSTLNTSLATAFDVGGLYSVEPLQALGFQNVFLNPSRAQLNVLQGLSSDLITGITADMRKVVNQQVRQAALGQISPFEAMKNVTAGFGGASPKVEQGKLVTKGISAKAEMDIRTEMQSVFNLSNHSQQMETAKQIPGLLKRWIATADGRTRRGHLEIHRETARKPIPSAEPYNVRNWRFTKSRGWQLTGETAKLDYPAQLGKPGWAVINCRCSEATIHPEIGVIGSSLDGRIGATLARAEER